MCCFKANFCVSRDLIVLIWPTLMWTTCFQSGSLWTIELCCTTDILKIRLQKYTLWCEAGSVAALCRIIPCSACGTATQQEPENEPLRLSSSSDASPPNEQSCCLMRELINTYGCHGLIRLHTLRSTSEGWITKSRWRKSWGSESRAKLWEV